MVKAIADSRISSDSDAPIGVSYYWYCTECHHEEPYENEDVDDDYMHDSQF